MGISGKPVLVVVDVQNDFCPGGALAVANGNQVVPVLNQYIGLFDQYKAPIVYTRDWHPRNHCSFVAQGGPWPPHCVQGTRGAEFHKDLVLHESPRIISKGIDRNKEAYSGFQFTSLKQDLKDMGITEAYIGGLATDYCVKSTVIDALKGGFSTWFLEDASRGVNRNTGDDDRAWSEMEQHGAKAMVFSRMLGRFAG